MRHSRTIAAFIVILQSVLFLAHYFLYQSWTFGLPTHPLWLKLLLGFLSISFVPASLLAFRYTNAAVRVFYRIAAVWMGVSSFLFIATITAWIAYGIALLSGLHPDFHRMLMPLLGIGLALGLYALLNAHLTRITRVKISLENLPEAWRGRKAALVSDLHLGPVRNGNFLRRIIAKILKEEPHAVFIAGDLYDGTAIDIERAAAPLNQLTTAPHGVYFVAGNHEQFRDDSEYLSAVAAAGVRVLHNEKVEIEGLQIVGVPYSMGRKPGSLLSALKYIGLDPARASILLIHAPDHPEVAEAAGFSLQLSGHTHLGQFVPWSWIARRIYRQFVYGLSRIGKLQVFTSSGAGTWGPPLRLGSNPEVVMLHFE